MCGEKKVASCQNWACMKEVYIAMTHSFPPQMELRQVQNGGGCPSRFYKNMHQSFFRSLCTSVRKKRWESYGMNWKLLQFMQNCWPDMILLNLIYISQGNKIYLIVTEKITYFFYITHIPLRTYQSARVVATYQETGSIHKRYCRAKREEREF